MIKGDFQDIQSYLTSLTNSLNKHGSQYVYTVTTRPVYRGVNPEGGCDLENYKINSIGTWPTITSTTKDYDTAL